MADTLFAREECGKEDIIQPKEKSLRDLEVQLVLSVLLGASALITFCILRPRWPSLYAARTRRLSPEVALPELSKSFFGWMPRLWRVTEEQVLASAGLDAFVFLAFFKMAIRLFAIMGFLATTILLPIHNAYEGFNLGWDDDDEDTKPKDYFDIDKGHKHPDRSWSRSTQHLWAYTVFTYVFALLAIYMINRETFRIIRYRQNYLGTQSTVTDRTFRLTGIPADLRSEESIKTLIEKLHIGRVESVTLCREWEEIDSMVEKRDLVLRKLEASWARLRKLQEEKKKQKSSQPNGQTQAEDATSERYTDDEPGETSDLIANNWYGEDSERPQVKLRNGFFGTKTHKVDAIHYYEETLSHLDDSIAQARKKTYQPTDMALVTMDTVASCQVVTQARIDPRPGNLLTKPTPAPSDLIWKNTYAPRGIRRLKSWIITSFITFLTLIWIFPTVALASLLSICAIKEVAPTFAHWLRGHPIIYSLVQNGLPTLVVSLLNVAVPYLYDFLSNHQGMISQGDVELSVISKNFFFIFFNTFFVFAASSTGFEFWSTMRKFIQDTSQIPAAIALGVERLARFYVNFIILQGIGLMPFRILEAGSVFLYPFFKMMATTPRDFEELKKPPIFQYGFYLPTALLVFNLCLIYSVLDWGFAILIFGVIYFALGYSTFKYMVLYAMDQPQHATGGAWRIICYRIVIGLLVFELVMVGKIATLAAFVQSVCILPLIPFTIWYSYYFKRRFEPLTRYIALRAIRAGGDADSQTNASMEESFRDEEALPREGALRRGSTIDERREKGLVFVNPSMVKPLAQPWIYDEPPPLISTESTETTSAEEHHPQLILPNADSSLGIGEDNVWSNDSAVRS